MRSENDALRLLMQKEKLKYLSVFVIIPKKDQKVRFVMGFDCTKYLGVILLWGMYQYNMLPMDLYIATDKIQASLGKFFHDMKIVLI